MRWAETETFGIWHRHPNVVMRNSTRTVRFQRNLFKMATFCFGRSQNLPPLNRAPWVIMPNPNSSRFLHISRTQTCKCILRTVKVLGYMSDQKLVYNSLNFKVFSRLTSSSKIPTILGPLIIFDEQPTSR